MDEVFVKVFFWDDHPKKWGSEMMRTLRVESFFCKVETSKNWEDLDSGTSDFQKTDFNSSHTLDGGYVYLNI